VRDYEVTVLSDGCAALDRAVQETALAARRPVATIMTIAGARAMIAGPSRRKEP